MTALEISEEYCVPIRTVYTWIDRIEGAKKKRSRSNTPITVDRAAIEPFAEAWRLSAAERATWHRETAERLERVAQSVLSVSR